MPSLALGSGAGVIAVTSIAAFRGNRWALRCNPSSGNLHPTEGYAVLPAIPYCDAGVYHYVSRDHCLERRCALVASAAAELGRALPADSFLVGLSSIHWREAWKYGERAFRYCQHDAGTDRVVVAAVLDNLVSNLPYRSV